MSAQERIKAVLASVGLPAVPTDPAAELAHYGMDSLMTVLAVLALEREFKTKIAAEAAVAEFHSVQSIEAFLMKVGAA